MQPEVETRKNELKDICVKLKEIKLYAFGSVISDNKFGENSDNV